MITPLAIIALAALIHASFQLSVSVLTLLSGHAIGAKTAHRRVLRLTSSYVLGTLIMTLLILTTTAFTLQNSFTDTTPPVMWAIASGLLLGLGVAVWAFYYRREKGTTLWLPRSFARFLAIRAKRTKVTAEAFTLGFGSVVSELLFIIAPMIVASLVLIQLEPLWQLAGIALYGTISSLSLFIVYVLIGSGHKLSRIQKWREDNKRFIQFAAGSGLLVLGFYVYVEQVITPTALASGGF
jgi:hypothetical protein